MIFDDGFHQLYNDLNAENMFGHIRDWMVKSESKKNLVLWNSAKVSVLKTDFLQRKNYVKKIILLLISLLIGLIAIIKKFKKFFSAV
jgi:hypothetical protein